jgi:endonuclease-8
MPEGHTIHRAARLQSALLGGRRVRCDSPQGRFDEGAALLDGRRLDAIEAYGKHLFYAFEDRVWLHVHLGLFGRFRSGDGPPPGSRGAVRLRLQSDLGWVSLRGPTACEIFDDDGRRRFLARIGPDPLRAADRPAKAIARILRSSAPFGVLLMDQSVLGGIGNVYRAELAFRAGIAPSTPGQLLDRAAVLGVWRDARALLRSGEATGRIVTTRPADRPHPAGPVRRGEQYYVYHRADRPCFVCRTPIVSVPLAGRTAYFCPRCQPVTIPSSVRIVGMLARRLKKPRVAAGHDTAS